MSAKEAEAAANQAIADKIEQYGVVGGDKAGMQALLRREIRQGLGLRDLPEPPPPIPAGKADELYEAAWKEAGLPDPDTLKKPRPPTQKAQRERLQIELRGQGLDKSITPVEVATFQREALQRAVAAGERPPAWAFDAASAKEMLERFRNGKVEQITKAVHDELFGPYQIELQKFHEMNSAHLELAEKAKNEITAMAAKQEADFHRLTSAVEKYNDELKVGFEQVRNVRIRIDKHIPWHYAHNADAVANTAAELKLGVRSALENKLESEADKVAAATGDPSKLENYLTAKQKYSQSADMLRMAERARARHASLLGRTSRVGVGNIVVGEMMGLMTGHPFAGAALGAGTKLVQHYGPKVAAWAMHKAAKLAGYKALRQEVLIAQRRGIRSALGREPEQVYYRVQPTGKSIFGHTSKLGTEPLKERHVFAYKEPGKYAETVTGIHTLKKPDDFEMVGFHGKGEYQPEDTEGFGVQPTKELGRVPMRQWAKLKIAEMSPAEARIAAAEAMGQVAKLAANPAELRSRLVAMDPSLPLVAPKSFAAAEGAFRRQVQWMLQQIPPHLLHKYQAEGAINPRDLTATQSRDFFEHALGTVEPRAPTDMLAAGNLSANVVSAHKANWPNTYKMAVLQLNRQKAMDRDAYDFLTPSRRAQHDLFAGSSDPSMTLQLQVLAANAIANPPPPTGRGKGGGMTHAAATSKGMAAMISLEASASQTSESGPPGRRGKSGRSAEANPGL